MRRSAAPSQIGSAAKKARFITPFVHKGSTPVSTPPPHLRQSEDNACSSDSPSTQSSAVSQKRNVLSLLQGKQNVESPTGMPNSSRDKVHVPQSSDTCNTRDVCKENDCSGAEDGDSKGLLAQSERKIQHSIKGAYKCSLGSMKPMVTAALKTSTLNRTSFKSPVKQNTSVTKVVCNKEGTEEEANYYSVMW